MNPNELIIKIYEYLGLEVGSLSSESGNDWERAKKEVLDDYKREQASKNTVNQDVNYVNVDKSSDEFISIVNSNLVQHQRYMDVIATRNDLSNNDILALIHNGSKETIMNLVRFQKLTTEQIDIIIPKSVYLVKIFLIDHQDLSDAQRAKIKI